MRQVLEPRGDLRHLGATPSSLHTRLLAFAERDPRRAAYMAHSWLGDAALDGRAGASWANYTLGWALLRWERVYPARDHIAAAHESFAQAGDATMAQRCRYGLLLARQLAGEGVALQDAWHELIDALERSGQWREVARARNEQIAHLNVLGRPGDARRLAETSAGLIERYGIPADQGRFDQVAGVALAGCGDLDAAFAQIERARIRFAALGRPVDVARVLFERAWIWQRRERFDRTRADLGQASATFRRFDLPLRVALCEKDLGIVAARVGDYHAGIAHALRARAQFAEIGRQDLVARCDLNLGAVAHYSGLFDLAIVAYRRAQAAYAELGDQRLFLICQRNQAMALRAQGHPAAALEMLAAIEQPVLAMGDKLEHAELLLERAGALHQLDATEAALDCLRAARRHFLALGSPVAAAECLLDQGWLHLDRQNWPEAIPCLRGALPLLADRPAHYWRALHGMGRAAEQQGDTATALIHYDAATAVIAGLRRRLASEHASSGIFAQASRLCQDALRMAARQGDLLRLLALAERQRALVLQRQSAHSSAPPPPDLQARRDRLRDQLRDQLAAGVPAEQLDATLQHYVDALLHARHHAVPSPITIAHEPFDAALLRQRLTAAYGTDWTLLVPLIVDDRLLLITLAADELTLVSTPYDLPLRDLIERASLPRYRMATYRDLARVRGQASTSWAALRSLAERLLPLALRARLHPGHRLLIAPCGPLHALPWAALRVGDAWLAELAIIQQVSTLAQTSAALPAPTPESRALLMGCETFGGRAPDLPGALASLDRVQACWPGTATRLESAQATRQALIELAAGGDLRHYQLIHIASHAQFGAARGLLGHIKLADDDLLIDEVLRLGLGPALVVLTACEGAAGEVLPGDEVLGISHALLAAGAATVVASLWPIYDLAVPYLLDGFYRGLLGGVDPALALTQSQRALLALSEGQDQHAAILQSPFVWASFCVTSVGMACAP